MMKDGGRDDLLKKYGARNVERPPSDVSTDAPRVPLSWLPEHPFHHGHPNLRDEVRVPGVMTSRDEATIRNELDGSTHVSRTLMSR